MSTGFRINERSNAIVRSNPEIFRMLADVYRRVIALPDYTSQMAQGEIETKRALIALFETALQEAGRDPFDKPDLSGWVNT